MSTRRTAKVVLGLLDFLLLAALLLLPLSWLMDPFKASLLGLNISVSWGARPVILTILLAILRAVFARRLPAQPATQVAKCQLAAGMTLVFMLLCEGLLSVAGFEHPLPPIYISSDQESPLANDPAIIQDRDLLWKFKPGATFKGQRVNTLGFIDREISKAKKPGTTRILCLGDSCTAEGNPSYSRILQASLDNDPSSSRTWETVNMGVHGYSVVQGLTLYRLLGQALSPDIVTIYFGWNDHWLDYRSDQNRLSLERHRFASKVFAKLSEKRLFQLMARLLQRTRDQVSDSSERVLRVPPDVYEASMAELLGAIHSSGATPILLTAPRASNLTRMLVVNGSASSVEEATRLHDDYTTMTRELAQKFGVPLLDLAAWMNDSERATYFTGDGIHLKEAGLELIASRLHRELMRVAESRP